MYKAYITYVKNIRPAENSDFLNACEVFGNTTLFRYGLNFEYNTQLSLNVVVELPT